jgi:hypothetical chaperone protein
VNLESTGAILPTALHLNRDYIATTGADAIERYVEENRGRRVEWVAEVIGEAASSVVGGDLGESGEQLETARNLIYGPLTDRGLPGRLFHGLKRLLGDSSIARLSVFDRPYRLVALITPILLRMRSGTEAALGQEVASVHVGRPVNFEGRDEHRNTVAQARLAEASEHAGLRNVQFYPEPIAATLSYLHGANVNSRANKNGITLAVDFGGGTLDLSVVRYAGTAFEVLATEGIGMGGNRIDQLIFEHLLFPELGQGELWARQVDGRWIETPFPFEEFANALLNWPITHTLNQNKTKTMVLDRIAKGGPAAVKFERLNDLITYNYSYNCFQAIRQAKAALSEADATTLDIPELNLRIPFKREQLDAMLAGMLETLGGIVDRVLTQAGLQRTDIDLVIRTGGSSLIVAVKQLLESYFPGRVVAHDPFTSVAGGLAIANYYGYVMGRGDE